MDGQMITLPMVLATLVMNYRTINLNIFEAEKILQKTKQHTDSFLEPRR